MERSARYAPCFILALALVLSGLGWSQEAAPPSLYLMADIQVEVAKAPEYEAALKTLIAALKESAFSVVFDTYATDDSHYYIIYGLESGYGAVDGLHKAWRDLASRLGPEKFQALHGRLTALETSRILRAWTFRTDLSFLPVPERLKPGEQPDDRMQDPENFCLRTAW